MKILLISILLLSIKTEVTTDTGTKEPEKAAVETTENTDKKPTENATEEGGKPAEATGKKCNTGIIKELGFVGLETSQKIGLVMCPGVKESCCQISDQVEIYNNWITKKEHHNLNERFAYHEDIYFKFLDGIEKVYGRAAKLMENNQHEDGSECRIISRRILHYQLPNIIPILKKMIKDMHNFYKETYKGVYCAVCDAESNSYINEGAKEVDFSKIFCRNIVKNSLGILLYFHTHIPRLVNLMSKFLVSCDHEGVYTSQPVPPDYFFNLNPEINESLESCKDFRNNPDWFKSCEKVCSNFNFIEFNKFFQPNLDEFTKYDIFLKENNERIDNMGKEPKNKEDQNEKVIKETNKSKARVLSETEAKTEEPKKDEGEKKEGEKKEEAKEGETKQEKKVELTPAEKYMDLNIFILKEGSSLSGFKANFKEKGISLYEIGVSVEINEKTLEKAKKGESPPVPEEPVVEAPAPTLAPVPAPDAVPAQGETLGKSTANIEASGKESGKGIYYMKVFSICFFIYFVFG